MNGVRIERDADYGEQVTIDRLPDLMMAIAFSLVGKPNRHVDCTPRIASQIKLD